MTECKDQIAISYNTKNDVDKATAVKEGLLKLGADGVFLQHLTISGYSEHPEAGTPRFDGWMESYFQILEYSLGMIVIATPNSTERLEGRGMWRELQLAKARASTGDDFVFDLVHPSCALLREYKERNREIDYQIRLIRDELNSIFKWGNGRAAEIREEELEAALVKFEASRPTAPAVPPSDREWVDAILPDLKTWIIQRRERTIPPPRRFAPEAVNIPGIFDPSEVSRAVHEGIGHWYYLSVLDYCDCVWHCRRCFATSDVWMRVESRPPHACPNCGYCGEKEDTTSQARSHAGRAAMF
jgi:hypothetical protein